MRRNLRIKNLVAVMGKMTTSKVSLMVDSFLSLVFVVFFEAAMTGGKSRCTTTYIRGYIK